MEYIKEDKNLTLYFSRRLSSENAAVVEKEIQKLIEENSPETIVLDLKELEYISSAGLRVILKVGKANKITIINASSDVYEILQMSGFTEIFEVKKALREVSIEGCKLVGVGASSKVYQYNEDAKIKVFVEGVSLERIYAETQSSKKSFIAGIPSAIPFDVVKCDGKYATLYEMINGASLHNVFMYEPNRFDELMVKYVNLLKQFHSTPAKEGDFPDVRDKYHKWMENLKNYMTEEEVTKIKDLFDVIPHRQTMLHVDPHGGNIMVCDDELMFIDMADISIGHPLIDVGTEYFHYMILKDTCLGAKIIFGVEPEDKTLTTRIWNRLEELYFADCSSNDKEDIHKMLKYFGCLRCLIIVAKHAQLPYEDKMQLVEKQRREFLPYIEEAKTLFKNADKYFK